MQFRPAHLLNIKQRYDGASAHIHSIDALVNIKRELKSERGLKTSSAKVSSL